MRQSAERRSPCLRAHFAGGALAAALLLAACASPETVVPSESAEAVSVIATPGVTQTPTPTVTPVNVQVVPAPRVAENENPEPVEGEMRFTRGQWATVLGASGTPVGRFTVTGVVFDVSCLEEDPPKADGSYVAVQLQVEGYGALGAEGYEGEFAPVFGFNRMQLFEKNSDSRLGESLAYDCIESSVQQREYGVGSESGYFVFDVPKQRFDVVWEYGDQTFRFVNLTA
ncbi:hypothetical protein [Pseudoclavibacter sp. AY1F1]|uniref:hypothetical protein n=1 Tax=Pseudoclavibacter sp. AY1F1 TaxID=2080583 RepID=UPI0011B0B898|nr:hypothetical protein [Pseudoclavibacter sp. AY1F1]